MVTYLLKSIENFIASRPDTALATLAAAGALLTLICLYLLAQVRTLKRRYARILRDERAGDLGVDVVERAGEGDDADADGHSATSMPTTRPPRSNR